MAVTVNGPATGNQGAVSGAGKVPPLTLRPTATSSDAPTLSYSTSAPTGVRAVTPTLPEVRVVGGAVEYSTTDTLYTIVGYIGMAGIDVIHTGTEFVFGWKCGVSAAERFQIYVDGLPIGSAVFTPGVSTTATQQYFMTLTFGSSKKRRVEIIGCNVASIRAVYVGYGDTISAAPKKTTVHITGDSFQQGSGAITSATQLPASQMALTYDVSVSGSAMGGTGFVKSSGGSPVFGDSTRVAVAAAVQPDVLMFGGSINDDDQAGRKAAAEECFADYKVACPTAKQIVFGPPPTNATNTVGSDRRDNCRDVQAAAAAAGVTYIDLTGWSLATDTPRTFAQFVNYDPGEIISHLGSLWQHTATVPTMYPNAGAPGQPGYHAWRLLSADVFGTGKVTATAGDGSRDVLIHSDNIHPTALWCAQLAARQAAAVGA